MNEMFQLAIDGLPMSFTELREGGVYWVTADHPPIAERLIITFLERVEPSTRYYFSTALPLEESYQAVLKNDQLVGDIFQLAQDNQGKWLQCLPDEMRWFGIKRVDIIIVQYQAATLENTEIAQLQKDIQTLSRWAEDNQLTLLVVGVGANVQQQRQGLNQCNPWLAGCVHLRRQAELIEYDLAYWRNAKGVSAGISVKLSVQQERLALHTAENDLVLGSLADEDQILAIQSVLAGTVAPSRHWKLFVDKPALLAAARQAVNATVIFAITETAQTDSLARDIYQLRSERGARLKIVVRETANCLRNLDDSLFLSAGANMVMPFSCHVSRFIGLLQMVQGVIFPNMLRPSIDSLLASSQPLQLKGYIPARDFYPLLQDEIDRSLTAETRGLLIILRPVSSLGLVDILAQCEMRRQGDVITVADDQIYIFFFACRPNDADRALQNTFHLPISTLFTESQVINGQDALQTELKRLSWLPEPKDYTNELLAQLGVRDTQIQEQQKLDIVELERRRSGVTPAILPLRA
ncbi:MAG: cellulose biosynthesis protein BcsE [Plesiomonas sp.]|uniref:cellulose biosynthesis protein BcsE n=1 Tax=Plesiomonas sp. TaxID=2486279 RepID=UPI003F3002B3